MRWLITLICALCLAPVISIAQQYTATDLGTLGGQFSSALAISDRGVAVGFSDLSNYQQRAFIWSSGTAISVQED